MADFVELLQASSHLADPLNEALARIQAHFYKKTADAEERRRFDETLAETKRLHDSDIARNQAAIEQARDAMKKGDYELALRSLEAKANVKRAEADVEESKRRGHEADIRSANLKRQMAEDIETRDLRRRESEARTSDAESLATLHRDQASHLKRDDRRRQLDELNEARKTGSLSENEYRRGVNKLYKGAKLPIDEIGEDKRFDVGKAIEKAQQARDKYQVYLLKTLGQPTEAEKMLPPERQAQLQADRMKKIQELSDEYYERSKKDMLVSLRAAWGDESPAARYAERHLGGMPAQGVPGGPGQGEALQANPSLPLNEGGGSVQPATSPRGIQRSMNAFPSIREAQQEPKAGAGIVRRIKEGVKTGPLVKATGLPPGVSALPPPAGQPGGYQPPGYTPGAGQPVGGYMRVRPDGSTEDVDENGNPIGNGQPQLSPAEIKRILYQTFGTIGNL